MAVVVGAGSFLLFFSLVVNVIALLVPYWVGSSNQSAEGLWGSCRCSWWYQNIQDIETTNLQSWHQASQWLYAIAVALMGIAMLTLFFVSCCKGDSYAKAMIAAGSFMLVAAILIAVSLIVYGVKKNETGVALDTKVRFMWGFWVGVVGFVIALVTSIVFLSQSRRVERKLM